MLINDRPYQLRIWPVFITMWSFCPQKKICKIIQIMMSPDFFFFTKTVVRSPKREKGLLMRNPLKYGDTLLRHDSHQCLGKKQAGSFFMAIISNETIWDIIVQCAFMVQNRVTYLRVLTTKPLEGRDLEGRTLCLPMLPFQ